MTAAVKLDVELQNRRQIFRIADPEFASLSIILRNNGSRVEATCLDISATGLGVLVPRNDFGSAHVGVILEYEIFFGPLSPVKGRAIIANRTDTALEDAQGPLLRLGLRFSDLRHESLGRIEQTRRSQRHFLPSPLRPLCVCSDPLWLGDEVSVQIHDLSMHGLSGVVSAKKTVFAEGLRTVFRIGFTHLGTYAVPVRIIYANPTEHLGTFRIGCEFVLRPEEFAAAVQTFFALFLLDQQDAEAHSWRGPWKPSGYILSDASQINEAVEALSTPNSTAPRAPFSKGHTLYACLASRSDETAEPYFRLETGAPDKDEQPAPKAGGKSPEESEHGSMTLFIDELHETSAADFQKILRTFLYLAAAKKVEHICLRLGQGQVAPSSRSLLSDAGLRPLADDTTESAKHSVADLLAGKGLTFRLWLSSFLPLSPFYHAVRPMLLRMPAWRRFILWCGSLLAGTGRRAAPTDRGDLAKSL